jgi:hypothetical protein
MSINVAAFFSCNHNKTCTNVEFKQTAKLQEKLENGIGTNILKESLKNKVSIP